MLKQKINSLVMCDVEDDLDGNRLMFTISHNITDQLINYCWRKKYVYQILTLDCM